jgi:signal recognition particle receptor subunit beta
MVSINYAFREISCKIVYYGPGLSGKTTNLQCVHDRLPNGSRGDLISLATEADRTLYFDFLPLSVGDIGGFATKFQMYTVPGQVFYNATRKLVLRGVDGIVFVADSQNTKMDENLESLADMYDNLKSYDIDPTEMPIVIQYNKRDLPDVATIGELEAKLNPEGRPYIEASAVNGTGVFDTVKCISKMVLENIRRRTAKGTVPEAAPAAKPEPVAVGGDAVLPTADPAEAAEAAAVAVTSAPAPAPSATKVVEHKVQTSDVEVSGKIPLSKVSTPVRRPEPSRASRSTIIAAQKSTRVRRRKRSLFERMFGWLLGR